MIFSDPLLDIFRTRKQMYKMTTKSRPMFGSYTEIGLHVFRKKRKHERKNVESI